jgi:hypothetical protein
MGMLLGGTSHSTRGLWHGWADLDFRIKSPEIVCSWEVWSGNISSYGTCSCDAPCGAASCCGTWTDAKGPSSTESSATTSLALAERLDKGVHLNWSSSSARRIAST